MKPEVHFGVGKAKAALDRRLLQDGTPFAPWRLHDLRRTVGTRMAEMGILLHMGEAVLNHTSGHKARVAGVYTAPPKQRRSMRP